jgi:hypothetical protein
VQDCPDHQRWTSLQAFENCLALLAAAQKPLTQRS